MDGERGRGGYDDLPTLLRRLKEYIAPWQEPKTALNKLRCKILNSCLDTGSKPKGIYTLTVPTGGGKTVASLAFALRHAVAHGMKRVIYVVPYTSIIEQNAEVFREILGDGNVLEHHSGVQFELSDGASPEEVRRALAAENWDMPVIVTTAVQFFESIYANRSSKCRKLHNLADYRFDCCCIRNFVDFDTVICLVVSIFCTKFKTSAACFVNLTHFAFRVNKVCSH